MLVVLLAASAIFAANDGWEYVYTTDGKDVYANINSVRRAGKFSSVEVGSTYPTSKVTDVQGRRYRERLNCSAKSRLSFARPLWIDSEWQLIDPPPEKISIGYKPITADDDFGKTLLRIGCGK